MQERMIDGQMHIGIWEPKSKHSDLISSIQSLHSMNTPVSIGPVSDIDSTPAFLYSSIKSKKEKKKDKKKKGSFDGVELSGSRAKSKSDDEDVVTEGRVLKFFDADAMFNEDPEDDIIDEVNREQRSEYKKRGTKETDYESKFRQEITILYELLDEVNKFSRDLDKKYRAIEAGRARGASKYVNDLILSILTSKTNKLNIIKEIAGIKKTIQDLHHKAATRNKESEGSTARDQLAASYIAKLIHGDGRAKMMERVGATTTFINSDPDDDDDDETRRARSEYESRRGDSDYQQARIFDMIDRRMEEEERPYRSDEVDRYVEYENRGVSIYIKKCIDKGSWEFMAIDSDNVEIYDYPLPRRDSVGKVSFSADGRSATDARGITYKVKEFFSPVEDHNE